MCKRHSPGVHTFVLGWNVIHVLPHLRPGSAPGTVQTPKIYCDINRYLSRRFVFSVRGGKRNANNNNNDDKPSPSTTSPHTLPRPPARRSRQPIDRPRNGKTCGKRRKWWLNSFESRLRGNEGILAWLHYCSSFYYPYRLVWLLVCVLCRQVLVLAIAWARNV